MFKSFVAGSLISVVFLQLPMLSFAEELQAGTPVLLRFQSTISSKEVQEGESITFDVVNDIVDPVTQRILIKSGTPATGSITRIKKPGLFGRKGELGIILNSTNATDGTIVPLRASMEREGDSKVASTLGWTVLTSALFWPAAPFLIYRRGKDAKIPIGTQLNAYIGANVKVSQERVSQTDKVQGQLFMLQADDKQTGGLDNLVKIEKLGELLEKGLITQSEFEAKKKQLLGL